MALDLGTLVARLRVENNMRRGLNESRRDLDQFSRDANGRLRDLRGRFASEGQAAGRALGEGIAAGGRRGVEQFTRDANGRLRDARGRFVSAARAAGEGVGDGLDGGSRRGIGNFSGALSGLGVKLSDLGKKGAASIGELSSSFMKLAKENPQVALGAVAGAIAGLPLIAGIAASAITVGLGGALSMIAIKAAASSKGVQDAFSDLRDDLKDGLRDAAAPFEGSLIRMIGVARTQLSGLKDDVSRAFATLAPAIEAAFGSVARAVGSIGPTLGYVAQQAAPLIQVLGNELGSLTKSLAGNFRDLAAAADPRFITILVGAVKGLADVITDVLVKGSQLGSWILDLVGMDRPAASARDLGEAFVELAAGARDVDEAMEDVNQAFAEFYDPSIAVFNATTDMRSSLKDLRKALDESKGSMEGNSDAALAARGSFTAALDSVRGMYEAQRQNGASHDEARAAISRQLGVLERLAGSNKRAKAQIDALKRSLDALKSKTVNVDVLVRRIGATDALEDLQRGRVPVQRKAKGGLVTGPGSETSDSVPAMLSNGEYVLPAKVTKRLGVKKLDALRRAVANGDIGVGTAPMVDSGPVAATGTYGGLGTGVGASGGRSSLSADLAKARVKMLKEIEQQITTLKAGLKKIRAAREDLLDGLTSMSADTVKSTANSLSAMVKEAFAGFRASTKIDDALLGRIKSTSAQLQRLADERTRIAERLQEALQFAASVTSRAQADSSVLGIEVVDAEGNRVDPTGAELATGLKTRLETLRKFSGDIRSLAAQGLSQTLLRDLMEAGPAAAGGIAEAIGQGGSGVIAQLTDLQNQIDAESKALGEFSADHLYDAGAAAGQGFLTGLTTQLDTLEQTMETLATNLINTVTTAIAAAQAAAEKKAKEIAEEGVGAKAGRGGKGRGPQDSETGLASEGSMSSEKIGVGKLPVNGGKVGVGTAPRAAIHIENYHEARGSSARKTGEELLLLTRARG